MITQHPPPVITTSISNNTLCENHPGLDVGAMKHQPPIAGATTEDGVVNR